jgi:phosphoglycerate kinase
MIHFVGVRSLPQQNEKQNQYGGIVKKTIRDIDVAGKRVLVRVDFNVPIEQGHTIDDARIRASIPTIRYLIEHQAKVILLTHLGNPGGYVVEKLRVNMLAEQLADALREPVGKVNNCIGPEVHEAVNHLLPGQVLLLENVRFHPGEMVNDAHFAARLSSFADIFVNDAFATLHRAHASTIGITRYLPTVAGLLVESEMGGVEQLRHQTREPRVILLGGTRLVDKAHIFDDFIEHTQRGTRDQAHRLLIGGVLANTFLRAIGYETGQSVVETEALTLARDLLIDTGHDLWLPVDVVVTDQVANQGRIRVLPVDRVPKDGIIVDIGPQTVERYTSALHKAGTVLWNGPIGITEFPAFAHGTQELAVRIAALPEAITVAGGGETIAILDQLGIASHFNYLSTGGAAFLQALQGRSLPGLNAIQEMPVAERQPSRAF